MKRCYINCYSIIPNDTGVSLNPGIPTDLFSNPHTANTVTLREKKICRFAIEDDFLDKDINCLNRWIVTNDEERFFYRFYQKQAFEARDDIYLLICDSLNNLPCFLLPYALLVEKNRLLIKITRTQNIKFKINNKTILINDMGVSIY